MRRSSHLSHSNHTTTVNRLERLVMGDVAWIKDVALLISALLNIGSISWALKSRTEKRAAEVTAESSEFKYYVARISYLEERLSRLENGLAYALARQPEGVRVMVQSDMAAYMVVHQVGGTNPETGGTK